MGRTNINLNDTLVEKAFRISGAATKRELVHKALEALVRQETRKGILKIEGKIRWRGRLAQMRKARFDSR
ncbi:MAG: type II toxin-antitoxin system VapB family antitoxin [Deltaproteobacteria bacterium]|nr:type II toxin-antitoxin system VapB family antitoxin [Deltaproteobacteria bacterium]MBI4373254.1 type II toxin-antitoxin system VapB family antitoxin [Deltaproteobacteria bacterium]